jgi:murein DD-endopeptidase MepM/ murein hydrolase activator NlpD
MKFLERFGKRYIYFVVFLAVALLVAGSVWQYSNYIEGRRAQLEFEKSLEDYYGEEPNKDSAVQIIQEKTDGEGTEAADTADIQEVANTGDGVAAKKAQAEKEKTAASKPNGSSSGKDEKAISAIKMQQPNMDTMVVPVFGTAYTEFADSSLVYSKTLEQWTTHMGLDIKADEGSPVRAAMDGVVEELTNDSELGLTIVINHGGKVFTKYSNLSTLDLVTVGQEIKKGDVISGIGKTALYEVSDDPHLHFEVVKDGKSMDPKKYLPKQSLKR